MSLVEREQSVTALQSTCRTNTTMYSIKTALESASVTQILGGDSDVYIGADEDFDCADQDGLYMENVVSLA